MNRFNIDKTVLTDLYLGKGLSTIKIGDLLGCSAETIRLYLKKYDIPTKKARPYIEDMSGRTFGLLEVLEHVGQNPKTNSRVWRCRCDCGTILLLDTSKLKERQSCGCLRKRTGKDHPAWKGHMDIPQAWWEATKQKWIDNGYEIAVSIEDIWNIYQQQKGVCPFSYLVLQFDHNDVTTYKPGIQRQVNKASIILINKAVAGMIEACDNDFSMMMEIARNLNKMEY